MFNKKWKAKTLAIHIIRKVQSSDFKNRKDVQWIEQNIINSGHVLDICCGPGLYSTHLLKKAPGIQYTGVDINHEYLKQAKLNFLLDDIDGVLMDGDAKELVFTDGLFDQVWLFNWWITGDDEKVLTEAKRILKDDGTLLINHPFFIGYSRIYSLFDELDSIELPHRNKRTLKPMWYKYLKMKKKVGGMIGK
jgi:ubiquinone/menaquinone biosynthesis C-methylase UbiE